MVPRALRLYLSKCSICKENCTGENTRTSRVPAQYDVMRNGEQLIILGWIFKGLNSVLLEEDSDVGSALGLAMQDGSVSLSTVTPNKQRLREWCEK